MPLMSDPERVRRLGKGGLDVLLAHPDADPARVAAIGYCFGGTMALELARGGADLKAVVGFHSGLPTDRAPRMPSNIKGQRARVHRHRGSAHPSRPARGLRGGDARRRRRLAHEPLRRRRPQLHESRGERGGHAGHRIPRPDGRRARGRRCEICSTRRSAPSDQSRSYAARRPCRNAKLAATAAPPRAAVARGAAHTSVGRWRASGRHDGFDATRAAHHPVTDGLDAD